MYNCCKISNFLQQYVFMLLNIVELMLLPFYNHGTPVQLGFDGRFDFGNFDVSA